MGKTFVTPRNKRGYGLKFKLETYKTVAHFKPGTKIKYGPNKKSVGSKSFVRYAKYEKAKTVGEALKCGSKLADLCWELERGQYKVLGGARSDAEEIKAIGKDAFDKAMGQLQSFNGPRGLNVQMDDARAVKELEREEAWREKKLKRCEELAPQLGLEPESPEDLEAQGIPECSDIRIQRRVGDALAAKKLAAAAKSGKKITDADVHEVLSLWGFAENENRFNVMPKGIKYVYSDTLGAIRRRTGTFGMTPPTRRYPNFPRLLCKWLSDHANLSGKMVCTAINVNANYAAKQHRDGNNEGPSVIKAFGDFKGGRLLYWPGDVQKAPRVDVDTLQERDAVPIDIRKNYAVFDGNKAHKVEPFKDGDRYSIVFFTAKGYRSVAKTQLKQLKQIGFPWPTPASMATLRRAAQRHMPKGKARSGSGRAGGA